jgi:nucleotide-binding universal stress UspA family protein
MGGRIVVGVDATEQAAAALRWAVEEATLRDATIDAVHAWSYMPMPTSVDGGLVPMAWSEGPDARDTVREAAERLARDTVRSVVGDEARVQVSVVEGDPADALLAAAAGADLLVVGNRGRGGLAQAVLGSTSARVADHAPCPVVVLRAPET